MRLFKIIVLWGGGSLEPITIFTISWLSSQYLCIYTDWAWTSYLVWKYLPANYCFAYPSFCGHLSIDLQCICMYAKDVAGGGGGGQGHLTTLSLTLLKHHLLTHIENSFINTSRITIFFSHLTSIHKTESNPHSPTKQECFDWLYNNVLNVWLYNDILTAKIYSYLMNHTPCTLSFTLSPSLSDSPTHSFAHSLPHTLVHAFAHSPSHALTRSLASLTPAHGLTH